MATVARGHANHVFHSTSVSDYHRAIAAWLVAVQKNSAKECKRPDDIEAKDSLEAGNIKSRLAAGFALALAGATGVAAQETSTNQVASDTAWSVFEDTDPRECWAVSAPTETVNTRDGRVVAVRRGDILLMTFFRPNADVQGQITFTGGYPFAEGSTVNMQIGGSEFELFTEGEWAWPASTDDDAQILAAMKRGAEAVLTARSSRGNQTKDTISLLGYTAAVEEAENRCN